MKMIVLTAAAVLCMFSCGPQFGDTVETAGFYATSYIKNEPENIFHYHPIMAYDSDPLTFWAESSKGPGFGDWIDIHFANEIEVDAIVIAPGCFDPEKYSNYNRVKRLKVSFSDNSPPVEVEFDDGMTTKSFSFSMRKIRSCSFTILDVYSGGDANITCIAEIGFLSNGRQYVPGEIAYFKDLLEKNREFKTPAGFRLAAGRKDDGTFYFFPDNTVLFQDPLRDKGTWSFDAEENEIVIELKQREKLEGKGESITHRSYLGTSVYHEEYEYTVIDIDETEDINWEQRRQRFLDDEGDHYKFYLLTREDYKKLDFSLRPEVIDTIELLKLTYESLKKKK
ncbi:MAG: hypothetical protein JW904_00990 [Spirochaetales bacterium]|nr:hypothetical protein [Spirochaetales bacterium]